MVRIANLRVALRGRGYSADGDLTLRVVDASRPETVRLVVRGGSAEVETSTAVPDIEMPRAILGSILVSGMRPTEAAELGFLRGHQAAVRLADDLFSGPRFRCLDPF
jgi:predicted acetyltransferase